MLRSLSLLLVTLLVAHTVRADVLSLYDVYAEAIKADPRVRIAQHQVELGKARTDSAFGALLPQASFTGNFSNNDVQYDTDLPGFDDQDYNGQRYGFQVRQTIFNWSTLSRHARENELAAQRESELLDVMSLLLLDTAERYFSVLLAEGDLRQLLTERELVLEQLNAIEEMFKRKMSRITDVLETQARADSVRTDVIEAENQVALARESLSEITGAPVGELASLRPDFELPQLDNTMKYWTELAAASNPLLQARREAVLAAKEGVQEQKGGHLPTVDLVFSDQTSDTGFDNQRQPERDTTYIAIDVTIPLYSGGSTSARVREAWAGYYIAREEEEQVLREILRRTREAWLNTRSSRKRIDAAALSVASAGKSYEAMDKSFNYGTVTSADVLQALAAQTRARRDYQNALYEFITSWLRLKRESGFLETEDLAQVNSWLVATAP